MAIRNTTGSAAGLLLDDDLLAIDETVLTALVRVDQVNPAGDVPIFEITGAERIDLLLDGSYGRVVPRLYHTSPPSVWEQYDDCMFDFGQWMGIAIDCSGVGTNQLRMVFATSADSYVAKTVTLGGSVWTPTAIRLLFGAASGRGLFGAIQNVKYGEGPLTAAQIAAECWSPSVVHSWAPLFTPMSSGADVATQAGDWTVVGTLALVDGHFTGTTGSAPTVTVSAVTTSGDAVTVTGALTSAATSQTVAVDLIADSAVITTGQATVAGLDWTATVDNIPAGVYSVRGRINDSNGAASNLFGGTVEIVGLSGTDQLPHLYTTTGLLAQPSTLAFAQGQTATVRAVNQAGVPVSGAQVIISNGNATAPVLTDIDGYVVVDGVAQGTATLTLRVMNLAGQTLSASVPVTIGAPSVSTITVSPSTASIPVNGIQQFTAVITGGGTTTWTVESGGGSIDSSGLYIAPSSPTTAVVRGAKTGELTTFDESTVTVTEAQSSIGGGFLGNANQSASPGGSFNWRIKVEVDGVAAQGAVVTPVASPDGLVLISPPLPTSADGTTTINAAIPPGVETGRTASVLFSIQAGPLSMTLSAVVAIVTSPNGDLYIRGRLYPRPYPQKD